MSLTVEEVPVDEDIFRCNCGSWVAIHSQVFEKYGCVTCRLIDTRGTRMV